MRRFYPRYHVLIYSNANISSAELFICTMHRVVTIVLRRFFSSTPFAVRLYLYC